MRKPVHILLTILVMLAVSVAVQAAIVEFSAPPNGSSVSGDKVDIVISINPSDNQTVSRVEVSLDGKYITHRAYSPAISMGNSVFRWDTSRTANGKHVLGVSVYSGKDLLGKASCEVSVSNKSGDTLKPLMGTRMSIRSPKDGQIVSGNTPIIIDATTSTGTDPFVSIYIDKSMRSASNVRPFKYDWDTRNVNNGPHYISAQGMDDTDNVAISPTIRVIVRNPVLRVPIAAESQKTLPVLPDLAKPAHTESAAPKDSKLTPSLPASTLKSSEEARTSGQTPGSSEKFEVNPLASPKQSIPQSTAPTAAAVSLPSTATAVSDLDKMLSASAALPLAAQPSAAAVTQPAQSAPSTSIPETTAAPDLMAKASEVDNLASKMSGNVLSTPSIPVTKSAPSVTGPKSQSLPALVDGTASASLSPGGNLDSALSTPTAQPSTVPASVAVASPVQSPSLSGRADSVEVAQTSPVLENKLATPAVPVVKIDPAQSNELPNLTASPSLTKSERMEVAQTTPKTGSELLTPTAPKEQPSTTDELKSAQTPSLANDLTSSATTVASDTKLSVPSLPVEKIVKEAPVQSNTISTPSSMPALAAQTDQVGSVQATAKSGSELLTPGMPREEPSTSVNLKTVQMPLLASGSASTPGTAMAENKLATPALPIEKPSVAAPSSTIVASPILMAKADHEEFAQTAVQTESALSTPSTPKARVITATIKQSAPKAAASPKSSARSAVVTPKRTGMVQIRPVVVNAGGTIDWDSKSKTVHAVAKQKDVKIKIGSKNASVNNSQVKMDKAAAIRKGRTMVTDTFVKDTFGLNTK